MKKKWKMRERQQGGLVEKKQDLGVSVAESVKTQEAFGSPAQVAMLDRQLKGIGGTLHVTNERDVVEVSNLAWKLSQQTKLPTVVVFRSPIIG